MKDDQVIVPPIYDNIRLLPNHYAIFEIGNAAACFNLITQLFTTPFDYHHISYVNNYLKLYKESNRCGIFDLEGENIIAECNLYDDFNLKDRRTKYMWARCDNHFHFINKHTGKIIRLSEISMAYDTTSLMIGKNKQDIVSVYSEEGYAVDFALREIVRDNGGYMTLYNYTYNIQHVIDINGNILNI